MLTFPLRASRFHRPNTAQWPVPLRDTQAPAPEHSLQVVKQQGPSEVEGPKCHRVSRALGLSVLPELPQIGTPLCAGGPEDSEVSDYYMDVKEVLSKQRAQTLPPHRPFDCTINLVPQGQTVFPFPAGTKSHGSIYPSSLIPGTYLPVHVTSGESASLLLKEHVVQVCWVLQLLLQNGLYGNLEKSLFCVSTISFLGVVVSQDGLSMEPLRTKVVRS
ncbi:thrombospondin-3b-like [Tachysurus ichikawai]